MKKEKPKFTVNKAQLAYMLAVTEITVTRWEKLKENPLPLISKGKARVGNKYDPKAVVEWRINHVMPQAEKTATVIDFNKERARHEKAKADAQELKNLVDTGQVARIELLEQALSDVCIQIAAKLGALPARIKNRVPRLNSNEMDSIKREIVKAQNSASEMQVTFETAEKQI